MTSNRIERLIDSFKANFDGMPDVIVRAPGRVNLIGEHTDYNDGFVLPIAIDRDIIIASRQREDKTIRLYSLDYDQSVEFGLDNIKYDEDKKWSNYPRGVAHFLQESGFVISGLDAVITGNVPIGAGLSSSAAMEVATAFTFEKVFGLNINPVEMALLCQRAENKFVGVNCGIMDQFISRLGKKDHALLLDCRSLEFELVPINLQNIKIVVCDTGKKRGLVDSEYNNRRAECERGVKILEKFLPGITALRDIEVDDIKKYSNHIPDITEKRCLYVVKENARVLESVSAIKRNDLLKFGELMNESHIGLRDEYEVSCPELDVMVEIAWSIDGVIGSRMTGAGFGGCTVSIVIEDSIQELIDKVLGEYPKRTGLQPEIYVCTAEDGANIVEI